MTIDEKLTALRDIIQVDIGERGLARDPERNLINACPDDFANACRNIASQPELRVLVHTGFFIPTANPPAFETDGPLGAVFLARAFQQLRIPMIITTEAACAVGIQAGLMEAAVNSMEMQDFDLKELKRLVSIAPVGALMFQATCLIAIERVGPAIDGLCYTMRGIDVTNHLQAIHHCYEQGTRLSIGIGDGGNEIGMGKIPVETIERNIPNGRQIACRVATDHLIVAGISNWGAYALAAGVALLRGQQLDASLFDPEREHRILKAMVERGPLVDGKTGQPTPTVDGVGFEEYIRPLTRIREILEDGVFARRAID